MVSEFLHQVGRWVVSLVTAGSLGPKRIERRHDLRGPNQTDAPRYRLSARSRSRLEGVDPRLVAVVERAMEITEQDFSVLQGVRSAADQFAAWRRGTSRLNGIPRGIRRDGIAGTGLSRHQTGRAVDLGPHPLDWTDIKAFKRVGAAMRRAAAEAGVDLVWGAHTRHGGDWTSLNDMPHFELAGDER